jgi:hypothetical protein
MPANAGIHGLSSGSRRPALQASSESISNHRQKTEKFPTQTCCNLISIA